MINAQAIIEAATVYMQANTDGWMTGLVALLLFLFLIGLDRN